MINFLGYFHIKSILFLIGDNIFTTILLFFSFLMLEKVRERYINREKFTMSVIFFALKMEKKKKIIYQWTSFSVLFPSLVWFNKEIFLNMWNIYTFIIVLFILNGKTSGKSFYFSHIRDHSLKINMYMVRVVIECCWTEESGIIDCSFSKIFSEISMVYLKVIIFISFRTNLTHSQNISLKRDSFRSSTSFKLWILLRSANDKIWVEGALDLIRKTRKDLQIFNWEREKKIFKRNEILSLKWRWKSKRISDEEEKEKKIFFNSKFFFEKRKQISYRLKIFLCSFW
jgi:hypothetical protein